MIEDWVQYFPQLLEGLRLTLLITGISLLCGIPLGLLLAVAVSARSKVMRAVFVAIVEFGRGAPALVVLQMVYFGLPSAGLTLEPVLSAIVAFTWTTAAYTSEIFRGGLQAVPAGEIEASHALGMTSRDTLRFIVIPQGMRIAIPALMGFAILIFQGTSLAYAIAVPEITSQAYSIGSINFNYLSMFVLAGLMYAAVSVPATWLTALLERRMARALR